MFFFWGGSFFKVFFFFWGGLSVAIDSTVHVALYSSMSSLHNLLLVTEAGVIHLSLQSHTIHLQGPLSNKATLFAKKLWPH